MKTIDLEDVTKEFLDDRIQRLINDKKMLHKRNRNGDSITSIWSWQTQEH